MQPGAIVEALQRSLPLDRILADVPDRAARDAWPAAAKWDAGEVEWHLPAAVVQPVTAAEVQQVVRLATDHGWPLVPYGAGSGVCGAAIPPAGAVTVDLRRLDGIGELNETNLTVTAGAGVVGLRLEQYLNGRGFTLGHYPQSLALATVGGWVATRASGTFSSWYGNIEDRLAALQAVVPPGELVDFRFTPRSATGPRIMDLFVGAEGTLGIVTEVTLKIVPLPEERRWRGVALRTWRRRWRPCGCPWPAGCGRR